MIAVVTMVTVLQDSTQVLLAPAHHPTWPAPPPHYMSAPPTTKINTTRIAKSIPTSTMSIDKSLN